MVICRIRGGMGISSHYRSIPLPTQGMARVVAVFGPPRWVGRDVAVQRRFTLDDVFVIIAPRHGCRRRPARCVWPLVSAPGRSITDESPTSPDVLRNRQSPCRDGVAGHRSRCTRWRSIVFRTATPLLRNRRRFCVLCPASFGVTICTILNLMSASRTSRTFAKLRKPWRTLASIRSPTRIKSFDNLTSR